ncbi:hypothetical protein [Photobacterium profundum]|nr:hypothetical protein [Photobacterium profundum]
MASKAKTKLTITTISANLSAKGQNMKAGRLRAILKRLGLKNYKSNWGVLKIVKGAYRDAVKRGDLIAAYNIKHAFVRDNGRYAWKN